MRAWAWVAVCLACLSCSASVRAQSSAPDDEARALFVSGRTAFEEGRFDAALHDFEASYALSGRAQLLYNIAQCHDRMRHDRDAIAAFERYLAAAPNADNRVAVEARLRVLRDAVAQAEAVRRAAGERSDVSGARSVDQPSGPAERRRFALGPVLALGAGTLVAGAGSVLMIVARQGGDAVEHAKVGSSYRAVRQDLDTAQRQWTIGQALVGAGVAAVGVGVVWLLVQRREPRASVHVALVPTGLRLAGRF